MTVWLRALGLRLHDTASHPACGPTATSLPGSGHLPAQGREGSHHSLVSHQG